MQKDIINKGQNNDSKGHNVLEIRWNNPLCAYCYKKAEKLSSAVYLVTNFIPESDPIRARLREKCLCLLSGITRLRQFNKSHFSDAGNTHTPIEDMVSDMSEIVALFEVAESCRHISTMNAALLKIEYTQLAHVLQNRSLEFGEARPLPEHFLAVPFPEEMKDKPPHVPPHKRTSRVERDTVNVRHGGRKEAILGLLDKKDKVNVRDVAEVVRDCGEKTIQRELLSLVKRGVLKKEGERRWSVYSRIT